MLALSSESGQVAAPRPHPRGPQDSWIPLAWTPPLAGGLLRGAGPPPLEDALEPFNQEDYNAAFITR